MWLYVNNIYKMVDIIPSSQLVIGHGAFSVVYRARLKHVSLRYGKGGGGGGGVEFHSSHPVYCTFTLNFLRDGIFKLLRSPGIDSK